MLTTVALLLGFWTTADVRKAFQCGIVRDARETSHLLPRWPANMKYCEQYEQAGWTGDEFASDRCFSIYNDRSPWPQTRAQDAAAMTRTDACFKTIERK